MTASEIRKKVTRDDNETPYHYLLRLNTMDRTDSNIAKLQTDLDKLNDRLKKYMYDGNMFPGQNIWIEELDDLYNITMKARKEGWRYDEPKRIYK